MSRVRRLIWERMVRGSIPEMSEQRTTVYVLIMYTGYYQRVVGVFATAAKAWQHVEAKAVEEGQAMMKGAGDTCDVGNDWYRVMEFEVEGGEK